MRWWDLSHCMKTRIPPPSLLPLEAPFLSLCPAQLPNALKVFCLPLTHSLTLFSLSATSTLLRLLLWVTFLLSLFDIFFFCTYLKHLKTAKYSLPERCPETPLLSGSKDTILLPFSVFAFFSLVSFSRLSPSPSEDFPKGFANGRSHLFLKMVQVTCFHLSFRGPFSSYSSFITLCLPKYWLSSSRLWAAQSPGDTGGITGKTPVRRSQHFKMLNMLINRVISGGDKCNREN